MQTDNLHSQPSSANSGQSQESQVISGSKTASRYKPIGDRYNTQISALDDLSKKEEKTGFLRNTIRKVVNFLYTTGFASSRTNQALRSQEHLMPAGSNVNKQTQEFLHVLKDKNSTNFDKLTKELSGMSKAASTPSLNEILTKPNLTAIQDKVQDSYLDEYKIIQRNIRNKLVHLAEGESILLDATSKTPSHAMYMRITKRGDTFDLEYANTGYGTRNDDFHPCHLLGQKEIYQTVAVLRGISSDKLLQEDFFKTFFFIAERGKKPKGSEKYLKPYENGGKEVPANLTEENTVNLMYQALRGLGVPERMDPVKDEQYFSRVQIGGSCAPSGIWAMARVVLTHDELKELKTDVRMNALLRDYKEIKDGFDNSATRKIMVLDQIQKLKRTYGKRNEEAPKIFDHINEKLLESLDMISPEMKVSKAGKPIEAWIDTQTGNVEPLKVKFKRYNASLKYRVSFSKSKELTIPYSISPDPEAKGKFKGDIYDNCYLLYYHVANGDQRATAHYLNKVLEEVESTDTNFDKGMQTVQLLGSLAQSISETDETRAGMAKGAVLNHLAFRQLAKLYNVKPENRFDIEHYPFSKDVDSKEFRLFNELFYGRYTTQASQDKYYQLHVGEYLSKDNMWQKAYNHLLK